MRGRLLIVSAPSGAGKSTLVRRLLERDPLVRLSVSHTTREPRAGEVEGRDYHFVTTEVFRSLQANGAFIESAEVHGNLYGTSRIWLEAQLSADHDVVLEIDWQGARQVRASFPGAVGIFVLPPSLDELERRLRGRGQDSAEVIARRLGNAREEIRHLGDFQYVILNSKIEDAEEDLVAIARSVRLHTEAQWQRCRSLFGSLDQD